MWRLSSNRNILDIQYSHQIDDQEDNTDYIDYHLEWCRHGHVSRDQVDDQSDESYCDDETNHFIFLFLLSSRIFWG